MGKGWRSQRLGWRVKKGDANAMLERGFGKGKKLKSV